MKITLFTANQSRHNYLINLLSGISKELFVVQENKTIFPGTISGHYSNSKLMNVYFKKVLKAQFNLFGNSYVANDKKNIKIYPMQFGDLNFCSLDLLKDFLKSDYYIVFGSSYIKGKLANFLVSQKAVNIHMGCSPYYRGTDCNFWALYDQNPHLVGSTIHLLSKGLDSGPILYHAMPDKRYSTIYEYTMSSVKSAFYSLVKKIMNKSILRIKPQSQDLTKEIRYSKRKDFNENVLRFFLNKKIDLKTSVMDIKLLKNPYFLSANSFNKF
jgi:hypothetical protein